MQTESFIEPGASPETRLRLFSLYVDFAAALRARWATSRIAQLAGDMWKSSTEMWNLDSLNAGEAIRKMITRDAAEADVLVVSVSSLDRRESELVDWLNSLAAVRTGRPVPGLFVGLLGDDNSQTGELDWTVKQLLGCAQRTDRDFIWRWMEAEAMTGDDWLADSVETLLVRKQLARDAAFLRETPVVMA